MDYRQQCYDEWKSANQETSDGEFDKHWEAVKSVSSLSPHRIALSHALIPPHISGTSNKREARKIVCFVVTISATTFTRRCISIGSESRAELVWLRLLFCLWVWAGGQARKERLRDIWMGVVRGRRMTRLYNRSG